MCFPFAHVMIDRKSESCMVHRKKKTIRDQLQVGDNIVLEINSESLSKASLSVLTLSRCLASRGADWSSQSIAPRWPIHLRDQSITDLVTLAVIVFPLRSQLSALEPPSYLFCLCISLFFHSSSIIISPNLADTPDIDHWLAPGRSRLTCWSEPCVSHYFLYWLLCVVIVSDNRWCGWSLCCPLPCIRTNHAG